MLETGIEFIPSNSRSLKNRQSLFLRKYLSAALFRTAIQGSIPYAARLMTAFSSQSNFRTGLCKEEAFLFCFTGTRTFLVPRFVGLSNILSFL